MVRVLKKEQQYDNIKNNNNYNINDDVNNIFYYSSYLKITHALCRFKGPMLNPISDLYFSSSFIFHHLIIQKNL